jgi:hypothetical protein
VNAAHAKLVQRVSAPLDTRDLVDFDRIAKKIIAALDTPSATANPKPRSPRKATRSPAKRKPNS